MMGNIGLLSPYRLLSAGASPPICLSIFGWLLRCIFLRCLRLVSPFVSQPPHGSILNTPSLFAPASCCVAFLVALPLLSPCCHDNHRCYIAITTSVAVALLSSCPSLSLQLPSITKPSISEPSIAKLLSICHHAIAIKPSITAHH